MSYLKTLLVIPISIIMYTNGLAQSMTIKQLQGNKITLAPVNKDYLPQGVREEDVPDSLLSIANHSSKIVTCLVMKWVSHQPGIPDQTRWAYFDGYAFPPVRTVIPKEGTLIVSQFGAQDQETFSAINSSQKADTPLTPHFGEEQLTGAITVSADLVVFEDGEILGDNTSHYDQAIVLRHKAMLEVASLLRNISTSEEMNQKTTALINESKSSQDKTASIKASLAQTVLRSPNRQGTVNSFAQHTIPPKFYRQQ